MRVLLDTHALLWFALGDPQAGHGVRTVAVPVLSMS